MHSENLADQERCLELARRYHDDEFGKYAERHADIIRRFGRFPHRNPILGRTATPEEQAFLDTNRAGRSTPAAASPCACPGHYCQIARAASTRSRSFARWSASVS